jgi:DNA repair exonuclease SbcCD nuclease subunit
MNIPKKVCLISDLHIGNNKDNDKFHTIALNYAEWLRENMEKKNVSTLIIAGDFFHNRSYITLQTLDVGHRFLDVFSDMTVFITVGNHDALFLNNSSVTSLSIFKKRKNVHVIDNITTVDGVTLCPWGTKVEDIPQSKIVVGHWDAQSFEMSAGKISTHGIKVSDLMNKCECAFSGHYHKPQIRLYDKKPFRYLGSPYQLNWGESGEDKFAYILDVQSLKVEKIHNDKSPRFEYINEDSDPVKVENNFICIELDESKDFSSIILKYENLKALSIKTTMSISKLTLSLDDADSNPTTDQLPKPSSAHSAIDEYVDSLDIPDDEKIIVAKDAKKMYDSCV